MSIDDIFGYKVYKPPPEKEVPYIEDLDFIGEVVSLIDPNADVIQDPAVQRIFKSLEGDRMVKIEDLAPDVRYDGWNKKTQYDTHAIPLNRSVENRSIQPRQPVQTHNIMRSNPNNQLLQEEMMREAQQVARLNAIKDQELTMQLKETKNAVEREIHEQLVEQLTIRAHKKTSTPEQQALIEKLYLDLKSINPELAFATLRSTVSIRETEPDPRYQQQRGAPSSRAAPSQSSRGQSSRAPTQSSRSGQPQLLHNQGSIVGGSRPESRRPRK